MDDRTIRLDAGETLEITIRVVKRNTAAAQNRREGGGGGQPGEERRGGDYRHADRRESAPAASQGHRGGSIAPEVNRLREQYGLEEVEGAKRIGKILGEKLTLAAVEVWCERTGRSIEDLMRRAADR